MVGDRNEPGSGADLRKTAAAVAPPSDVRPEGLTTSSDETMKALEAAVNQRMEKLLRTNIRLRIQRDQDSDRYVYQGIDKITGEVQSQWPAETILRMLGFFRQLEGLLVDKEI